MRTGNAVFGALPATALACAWISSAASAVPAERPGSAAFSACAACHSLDGSNGTGPSLKGIMGRTSGTVPGFRYSRAMKSAAITWDEASLDRYLADPQEVVPGNIMAFSGVADAPERAEIIAYLKTVR